MGEGSRRVDEYLEVHRSAAESIEASTGMTEASRTSEEQDALRCSAISTAAEVEV